MDTKIHLCDSCRFDYLDCNCIEVVFGDGVGNDNIISCDTYIKWKIEFALPCPKKFQVPFSSCELPCPGKPINLNRKEPQ